MAPLVAAGPLIALSLLAAALVSVLLLSAFLQAATPNVIDTTVAAISALLSTSFIPILLSLRLAKCSSFAALRLPALACSKLRAAVPGRRSALYPHAVGRCERARAAPEPNCLVERPSGNYKADVNLSRGACPTPAGRAT
jgi:hypothetical protein